MCETLPALMQAISGPHLADPQNFIRTAPPDFSDGINDGIRGLRVGFSPDLGYGAIDPAVLERVKTGLTALEQAGAHVEEAQVKLGYE